MKRIISLVLISFFLILLIGCEKEEKKRINDLIDLNSIEEISYRIKNKDGDEYQVLNGLTKTFVEKICDYSLLYITNKEEGDKLIGDSTKYVLLEFPTSKMNIYVIDSGMAIIDKDGNYYKTEDNNYDFSDFGNLISFNDIYDEEIVPNLFHFTYRHSYSVEIDPYQSKSSLKSDVYAKHLDELLNTDLRLIKIPYDTRREGNSRVTIFEEYYEKYSMNPQAVVLTISKEEMIVIISNGTDTLIQNQDGLFLAVENFEIFDELLTISRGENELLNGEVDRLWNEHNN